MSGDTSAVAVSIARTDPFPLTAEEALLCGANAVIAAAGLCLQIRPSSAMRTWKSGQVQEPFACYVVPKVAKPAKTRCLGGESLIFPSAT